MVDINACLPSIIRDSIAKVYKYYTNEDFRKKSLEQFDIGNEIFSKSNQKSQKFRSLGNELYKQSLYNKALEEYTKSILAAELNERKNGDEDDLCLCLSNRSVVLMKLEEYSLSLQDINYALERVKTSKQREKLEFRKRFIETKLNSSFVSTSNKSEHNSINLLNETETTLSKPTSDLTLLHSESPLLLISESLCYYTHCYYCLKSLIPNFCYPCLGCRQVRFCSKNCATRSWITSHKFFCMNLSFFDRLPTKQRYLSFLACQLILSSDWQSCCNTLRSGKLPNFIQNYTEISQYDELIASLLTFFTHKSFFPTKNKCIPWKFDIEIFAGLLMASFKCLEQQVVPLYDIHLIEFQRNDVKIMGKNKIGYGIYNFLQKLKHSCKPNCSIVFKECATLSLYSVRPLSKDEVLTINHQNVFGICESIYPDDDILIYENDDCSCIQCETNRIKSNALICDGCLGYIFPKNKRKYNDDKKEKQSIEIETYECKTCNKDISEEMTEKFVKIKKNIRSVHIGRMELSKATSDLIKAEELLLSSYKNFKKILHEKHTIFILVCGILSYCYMKMRNYRMSLIYEKEAWSALTERYDCLNIIYLNGLIKIIERSDRFIKWMADKHDRVDYLELLKITKEDLKNHCIKAKQLLKLVNFEMDYFKSFIEKCHNN